MSRIEIRVDESANIDPDRLERFRAWLEPRLEEARADIEANLQAHYREVFIYGLPDPGLGAWRSGPRFSALVRRPRFATLRQHLGEVLR